LRRFNEHEYGLEGGRHYFDLYGAALRHFGVFAVDSVWLWLGFLVSAVTWEECKRIIDFTHEAYIEFMRWKLTAEMERAWLGGKPVGWS